MDFLADAVDHVRITGGSDACSELEVVPRAPWDPMIGARKLLASTRPRWNDA